MGENARFKNGHARVSETLVLKTLACRNGFLDLFLSNGRQRVGAFKKTLACRKNAFKHSYTVECGNRLRVGVRAKNAVACRWFACP